MASTGAADSTSDRPAPESWRSRLLLGVATAASLSPLLAAKHLPFTDLPEHAAVASALAHWHDPAFRVAEHYTLTFPRTPYALFHLVAAFVTLLVGDAEVAVRLLLVATAIALPLSLRSLLGALALDRRLALFAPMVFWNRALVIGLLPFVTSMPVLVFAIATAVRVAKGAAPRGRLWLAGVSLVLFYLHVSSFIVFVVTTLTLSLYLRGLRRSLRESAWLLPAALSALAWISMGQLTTHGDAFLERADIEYMSPARALFAFPLWIHDVWKTHFDESCAILWWGCLVALATASMRGTASSTRDLVTRVIPLGCALLVYLLTPHAAGVGVFLNVRLAPLLALFAIPVIRIPKDGALTRLSLAGAFVATLIMAGVSFREIAAAERDEMTGFDALLAHARPAARVVALNFDTTSAHAQFAPWLYAVAYHRIRTGGVTDYSFAHFQHWPLAYRPGRAPPSKPKPFWATDPCVFRNTVDGRYFDYVLTRGERETFAADQPGPQWRRIAEAGMFRLYEKTGEILPSDGASDLGPCKR